MAGSGRTGTDRRFHSPRCVDVDTPNASTLGTGRVGGDRIVAGNIERVYSMRMARVNITVPDEVVVHAKAAGLNVSRLATAALLEELDRRSKIDALDAYLAQLESDLGPVPADEHADAATWADRALAPPTTARATPRPRRRRRA